MPVTKRLTNLPEAIKNIPKAKLPKSRLAVAKRYGPTVVVAVLALVGLLFYFRNQLVVATVNGRTISRLALIRLLEENWRKDALEQLITKDLVLQEAAKQKVTVSQTEIEAELNKFADQLKQQGQDLEELLKQQGLNKDKLKEQIRIQLLVEKIVGKDVSVSDDEANKYLEANKKTLPEGTTVDQVKAELRSQKLNEKVQEWLKQLRDGAKIVYL